MERGDKVFTKYGTIETYIGLNKYGQVVTEDLRAGRHCWHPSNVWAAYYSEMLKRFVSIPEEGL